MLVATMPVVPMVRVSVQVVRENAVRSVQTSTRISNTVGPVITFAQTDSPAFREYARHCATTKSVVRMEWAEAVANVPKTSFAISLVHAARTQL